MARFAYDGSDMIAEYQGGAVQRRYVFGPGTDEPIVQYDAAGNRSWMTADERGSIVALANDSGTATAIDTYDEYGKPGATNSGRFQYTGQVWLPEAVLYHYKARDYLPQLGVFAEPDPIGQDGGPNLYAYVLNDPVNATDPTGLDTEECHGVWVWVGTGTSPTAPPPQAPPVGGAGWEVRQVCTIIRGGGSSVSPPTGQRGGPPAPGKGVPGSSTKPKPPPTKSQRQKQVEQACKSIMSVAVPALGIGYGALEGTESYFAILEGAAAMGLRGTAVGPFGALAGAAIGGMAAWFIVTYGPQYIPQICEKQGGPN